MPARDIVLLRENPLTWMSVAFITGLLVQRTWEPMLVLCTGSLMAGVVISISRFARFPGLRFWLAFSAMCMTGAMTGHISLPEHQPDHLMHTAENGIYTARVKECNTNASGARCFIQLRSLHSNGKFVPVSGKLIAYIRDISTGDMPLPGDTLIFEGIPQAIPSAGTPFEFDFEEYYRKKNTTHRIFLDARDIGIWAFNGFSLRRSAVRLNHLLVTRFRTLFNDEAAFSIVVSMLLGDRSSLDQDLRNSYADAGAIHILAISGLHIGIIAAILLFLTGKLRPQQSIIEAVIKSSIVLSGIWAYALLSGMSPSAVRASLMFSLYAIGRIALRRIRPLNILSACALITLLVDPVQIYSVSFQFSYLALAGILIFGTRIYHSLPVRTRALQWIWGTVAISIGAQTLIAPASLFYFNQVSVISALTSIVAIPAAFLIISSGVLTMLISFMLPALAVWPAMGLELITTTLNRMMILCASAGFSTIRNVWITEPLVWLIYGALLAIALRILTRRRIWTVGALTSIIGICAFAVYHKYQTTSRTTLTVYNHDSQAAIDYCRHGACLTTISVDPPGRTFTEQNIIRNRIRQYASGNVLPVALPEQTSVLIFDSLHIAIIRGDELHIAHSADIIMVESISEEQLVRFLVGSHPSLVVTGNHIEYRDKYRIKQLCSSRGIPNHDLSRDGAFFMEI